jgi:RNA polymerase sigma factor
MQPVLINERVESIKNDDEAVNRFVEEFKPFIASCSEKVTGRYMRYGEDDELSIALMAFAEAIKSYDSSKGSFLSFAQNVIKRRLVDFFRKERRHSNVVSLDEYSTEEGEEFDLSAADSIERHSAEVVSEYRRLEIEELKNELMQWGISFNDLVHSSPKHAKTRQICKSITDYILSSPQMVSAIKQKKYLPVLEIEKTLKIPRKNIERARKYIIAVILIKTGDYEYIKDYIK